MTGSRLPGLNRGPTVYKTVALPTELRRRSLFVAYLPDSSILTVHAARVCCSQVFQRRMVVKADEFTYEPFPIDLIDVRDSSTRRHLLLSSAIAKAIKKDSADYAPYFLHFEPVEDLDFSRRIIYPYLPISRRGETAPLPSAMSAPQLAADILFKLMPSLRFPPEPRRGSRRALRVSRIEVDRGFLSVVVDAAWM